MPLGKTLTTPAGAKTTGRKDDTPPEVTISSANGVLARRWSLFWPRPLDRHLSLILLILPLTFRHLFLDFAAVVGILSVAFQVNFLFTLLRWRCLDFKWVGGSLVSAGVALPSVLGTQTFGGCRQNLFRGFAPFRALN